MLFEVRKNCRICGSTALHPVVDLREQYLQGSFIKPGMPGPPSARIPMQLVRCDRGRDPNACGLLQLSVSVSREVLYRSYWYRSGTNQTMRDHLKAIADDAASMLQSEVATVLDIGCNDGTLLKCYPRTFRRVGIDPSDAAGSAEGELEVVHDFFPSRKLAVQMSVTRFDIITSIAMFYDLELPVEFVNAVRDLLHPQGIWIFEMSYMPKMLEMNSYDTICHEHLEYYSLSVIERLLRKCGLKVVKVSFNDINGGSIRCYAAHKSCTRYDDEASSRTIHQVRSSEADLRLDTDEPYLNFQNRIEVQGRKLSSLISELHAAGKVIHVYGASTKGNTILQWCGIDRAMVPYAAERNPDKIGARTLGTDIQIISEEESRAMKPDYYLVLPWHFRSEFVRREAAMLEQGTKFIFPLPSIEIVGK